MDDKAFSRYIELKSQPILARLQSGIFSGGFDFAECAKPKGKIAFLLLVYVWYDGSGHEDNNLLKLILTENVCLVGICRSNYVGGVCSYPFCSREWKM